MAYCIAKQVYPTFSKASQKLTQVVLHVQLSFKSQGQRLNYHDTKDFVIFFVKILELYVQTILLRD